jgi:hypothetical protein
MVRCSDGLDPRCASVIELEATGSEVLNREE